jgi:hypothetical protein
MAEYKLSYTASEIDEKLGKIDNMSWNDLKDKPFYSEMAEGAASFDGDLTGKEYLDMGIDCILTNDYNAISQIVDEYKKK